MNAVVVRTLTMLAAEKRGGDEMNTTTDTRTLDEFAHALADGMGTGRVVEAPYDHARVIRSPVRNAKDYAFFITVGHGGAHFHVSIHFPRTPGGDRLREANASRYPRTPLPEANIGRTRDIASVVKDVYRRVLDPFRADFLPALLKRADETEAALKATAAAKDVLAATGVATVRDSSDILDFTYPDAYGDVRVNYGGTSVELHLRSLPVPVAEKVLKLLGAEKREH